MLKEFGLLSDVSTALNMSWIITTCKCTGRENTSLRKT